MCTSQSDDAGLGFPKGVSIRTLHLAFLNVPCVLVNSVISLGFSEYAV